MTEGSPCSALAAQASVPGTSAEARCSLPCAAGESGLPAPLSLSDALTQFEREAVTGVCDTGRYRMPYYVWGSGPPLVFIHGLGDCSRSFLLTIARLSSSFRCIAYDFPTGYQDGARLWRYDHSALVDDFSALLDHLKLERTYILGSSFGSTVALEALRRWPERLPRGVLQGALAYRPLRRAELWLARLGRFLPGSMAGLPLREKILTKVNAPLFAQQPEDIWRAFLDWTGQARIASFAHQALWLHRLDLRLILSQVRQPVLLVVGDQDRVVPWPVTEVLLEGLPNAGRAIIEGCGHAPSYTHPEQYAALIRHFLTPPTPGCETSCPGTHATAAGCAGAAACGGPDGKKSCSG